MESSRYAPPKADVTPVRAVPAPAWSALETPASVWTRRLGAGGLALAFFLPLTSCSGQDYSAATLYPWPSIGCGVAILLFFWPAAWEIVLGLVARSRSRLRNPWPRVVLTAATVLGITWPLYWSTGWGGHTRYGAIVAYAACAGYAIGLGVLIRRRRSG